MVIELLQRCGINTSYTSPTPFIMPVNNPDFQFNRSLTRQLKLTETFCKPFVSLHLPQSVERLSGQNVRKSS
ncbi:hypothetical protein A3860_01535 [Niastella vici]|uniref:Uncharacterized protein n=1 Tax=Niastella vici TaxID=1703345 RepID=A0A1V9G9C1_9BACT|nr:hypothetical protein A3860_01535 [Niastella vici]